MSKFENRRLLIIAISVVVAVFPAYYTLQAFTGPTNPPPDGTSIISYDGATKILTINSTSSFEKTIKFQGTDGNKIYWTSGSNFGVGVHYGASLVHWASNQFNWRKGATGYDNGTDLMYLDGNGLNVYGSVTSTSKITAPTLCISSDCRSAWPAGGGGGSDSDWIVNGNVMSAMTLLREMVLNTSLIKIGRGNNATYQQK